MKYRFNVGTKVNWIMTTGQVDRETCHTEVSRVKGRWCWTTGNDAEWNCYDRNTGRPKECPIPGISARIEPAKSPCS